MSQPTIHLIGNAHLDPVWLWRWQDGFAEIKATFQAALDRIEAFPDFVFTCSSAAYYRWVEENAPEMFSQIQRRVAEGRWAIVGGWWVQPDCNLPSGESYARHALYSQRYFQAKFGRIARTGYNVDSFGHHAMVPQLLRLARMDAYVMMRPDPTEKDLPANLFRWEGADGTSVPTFRIPPVYSTPWNVAIGDKLDALAGMADAQGVDQMCFYGVGNHGGGPTIRNLREIEARQKQDAGARFVYSDPDRYFDAVAGREMPTVAGELQRHAVGCYSAHSATKTLNRRAETRIGVAESFAALASALAGFPYPAAAIQAAWEKILFNQFHDTLGGCCIPEAHDDAGDAYGAALHESAVVLNGALQTISWAVDTGDGVRQKDAHWRFWGTTEQGTPVVVFNPLPWEATLPVQLPQRLARVTEETGAPLPIQHVRAARTNVQDKYDTLVLATLPPLGYRLHWIFREPVGDPAPAPPPLQAAAVTFSDSDRAEGELHAAREWVRSAFLENDFVRVEFDRHTGAIARWQDKLRSIDLLAGPGAVGIVLDESHADTWAHGINAFRDEIGRFTDGETLLLESGPLRARVRTISQYGRSTLRQDFVLYAHRPDVLVHVTLDWHERHKLLKLAFPVAAADPSATFEIPYGHLVRPVDGIEVPGQRWVDLSGTSPGDGRPLGVALLNDSKYAFDVRGSEVRMTVARGAMYAEHRGERDVWNEFLDQGLQRFTYALVPHAGDWRVAGVVRRAAELHAGAEFVVETYHTGPLPPQAAGVTVSNPAVVVTVFKRAEEGGGWIVRCHESAGRPAACELSLPFCNRSWSATFRPQEIQTFLVPDDPASPVAPTDFLERI